MINNFIGIEKSQPERQFYSFGFNKAAISIAQVSQEITVPALNLFGIDTEKNSDKHFESIIGKVVEYGHRYIFFCKDICSQIGQSFFFFACSILSLMAVVPSYWTGFYFSNIILNAKYRIIFQADYAGFPDFCNKVVFKHDLILAIKKEVCNVK